MSTRTNIVITVGSSVIYLYRHHDGYLAETGADVLSMLRAAWGTPEQHYSREGAADRFLRAIFAAQYDQQSYEKTPRPIYELTSEIHGDIEHVYCIEFKDGGEPVINHAKRPRDWHEHGDGFAVERWVNHTTPYSLSEFAQLVNQDRRETNARLAELKAKNPGSRYGDGYEMVSL